MTETRRREPRVTLPLRIYPETLEELDRLAREDRRTRSDMARLLIAEGLAAWKRKRGLR